MQSGSTAFARMHWKDAALERLGLPNIGYPVPAGLVPELVDAGGHVPFEAQLYWLQEYVSRGGTDWLALEPAMLRLAELIAEPDQRDAATVAGDDWFLELRRVDLDSPIVTIQRGDHLLAALEPRDDGRLAAALYHPLDAKSLRYLLALARNPDEQGYVCLRENNWEFALDQACGSLRASYACERGEAYLSIWEYGLGVVGDGTLDRQFLAQHDAEPIAVNLAAIQIGTYYQLAPELGA